MNESMHGLLSHGDAVLWGMGWGRFAFGVLLIVGLAVLIKLTLFRNSH